MSYLTVKDGTEIYYKNWGPKDGQVVIVNGTAETMYGLQLLAREDRAGARILPTYDLKVFHLYLQGDVSQR